MFHSGISAAASAAVVAAVEGGQPLGWLWVMAVVLVLLGGAVLVRRRR